MLGRGEVVIMDMAAGIEHLGRGTAEAVDRLIVVVEPGRRSLDVARRIRNLAADIGLTTFAVVGNKVRGPEDRHFLERALEGFPLLGFIPYDQQIIQADLRGEFAEQVDGATQEALENIARHLHRGGSC
jgi:CO dehydrogenase maturation factor